MALTDKIIIDVDAETARLWREAGDQERLRLMLKLQLGLLSKASGSTEDKLDIVKELNRLHQKALEYGMDKKVQQELLKDLGKS